MNTSAGSATPAEPTASAGSAGVAQPASHNTERPSARERRQVIMELLEESDRVSVAWLAERFGVSDVSIRRDLTLLEDAGQLRRVHGAAVPASRGWRERSFATRSRENRDAKARIGSAAARLIKPADVIVFDSGSTVAQVAAHVAAPLRRSSAITMVTNSIAVLDEVSQWDSPHLICLGGLYLPEYQAFAGPQTVADLRGLSADVVFMGCDGLSVESGLTTPHILVAEVGATMATRARKVVVVADGSKVGRSGFTRIVDLDAADVLITDASANEEVLERARNLGIEVVLA